MNRDPLVVELKKAHALARQFTGGYSNRFVGAAEFSEREPISHGRENRQHPATSPRMQR